MDLNRILDENRRGAKTFNSTLVDPIFVNPKFRNPLTEQLMSYEDYVLNGYQIPQMSGKTAVETFVDIYDKIDSGLISIAHLDDIADTHTRTVEEFCSWYGIDEDTLMDIVKGEYAVLTFNDLTGWTLIGTDAVQDDEDSEIIFKYNVKFTCEGQLYEVSLDVENQTVTTSIQTFIVTSEDINKVVVLTESEYEALSVKNSKTEYNIIPD